MNFYKHHLGDYDGATAHLTWDEDMAYTRLLRAYYRREKPISDADKYRLVRANGRPARAAVDTVLAEFFNLRDDGWHNKRADEEIERYLEEGEDSAAKKENERDRQKRHRQRRKELFAALREHDIVPKYDTQTEELQRLLDTHLSRSGNGPVTRTATAIHKPEPEPLAKNQEPEPEAITSKPTKVKSASTGASPTAATWAAYSDVYQQRYGVEPTRNASVNGQLAQFVSRVPAADAPAIAMFFVRHNKSYYVSSRHSVGALLRDAEGLRTEWLSGRTVTDTEARQADRTQANGNVFGKLIEEARNAS